MSQLQWCEMKKRSALSSMSAKYSPRHSSVTVLLDENIFAAGKVLVS